MNIDRLVRVSFAACLGSALAMPLIANAQTTQPAASGAPTTQQAEEAAAPKPVEVDPKAADLINEMKSAYGKLTSLDVSGKVSGNFDVAGQKNQHQSDFTGSFQAPNKFRHESKEGVILGSTGEKLYVYSPTENVYSSIDASKDRFEHVPQPIGNMLFGENPSLLMAISQDPTAMFEGASVKRTDDVAIDGKQYAALKVTGRPTDELTLLVDPTTKLLKRVSMDLRKSVEQRGAPDIKAAEFVVDYTTTATDAAPKPEQFAWTPPQGARDAAAAQQAAAQQGEASALEGKPAPAFALKGLDDKEVKLADLKGKVVVLDFWATWCGPCVASLPNLDKFAKEQGEKGAKVFAVNLQEEKEKVQTFITNNKLTVSVLLDSEGKTGEAYGANAIPETVIIGKDGKVLKVLVGGGQEEAIEKAVAEAMKAK